MAAQSPRPIEGGIYIEVPAEVADSPVATPLIWFIGRVTERSVVMDSYEADRPRDPPTTSRWRALREAWDAWGRG